MNDLLSQRHMNAWKDSLWTLKRNLMGSKEHAHFRSPVRFAFIFYLFEKLKSKFLIRLEIIKSSHFVTNQIMLKMVDYKFIS